MVWLSKILGMTYNLERREYHFKIKSRWDQDACYKQSWFWLPCCHLIPQRSATVRQSFSSIRTVPNNQWHQVTIIVSQKKKVTLIIILLDQKVQLISHFIELHTLMIYQLFGGTIHAWSGKVSYHPFRRQCFDYYHDITVIHLLRDQSTATTLRRSSVIHYGIKTRRAATTWMNCIDIYWCREQQLQENFINRIAGAHHL